MKNVSRWKPSKYKFVGDKLKSSRKEEEVRLYSRLMADIIAAFYQSRFSKYAKGRLLDLGCGNVPFYEAYHPYVSENICIDWENTTHNNIFLDYSVDLNKPLPLESNMFDTIILSDVLEHILAPQKLWREMYRVMNKDGILMMNVPFLYWLHEEPFDYFRYTKHALIAFAEESGFEIIELTSLGGAPEVVADILSKNMVKIPYLGRFLAQIIQWVTVSFVATTFGTKVSNKTGEKFPLAYGLIAVKK